MYESYSLGDFPARCRKLPWLQLQPAGSGDDASAEDHLELPPGSQTQAWVSVSLETFSAIIVKWNWPRKQTRSLSISTSSPGRACLGDGFFCCSLCLFVCLFGLEPSDTQHGASRNSTGMEGMEVRMRWGYWGGWGGLRMCDMQTSPRGDERPAEKLPGKAARQIHTDPRIMATKTDRCLWSCSRGFYLAHMLPGCKTPLKTLQRCSYTSHSAERTSHLFPLMCRTLLQLLLTTELCGC